MYRRKTKNLLENTLYSRNLIKGIIEKKQSSAGYILFLIHRPFSKLNEWTKKTHQSTWKLVTIHKVLQTERSRRHTLCVKKRSWKRTASIKDYIDASIQGLKDYIKKQRIMTNNNYFQQWQHKCICRKQPRNRNGEKSSVRYLEWHLGRLYKRRQENDWKHVSKMNTISSNSNRKKRHKDQLY